MKTLKFSPNLVELIIKGSKTTTWRLFDEKDIQAGDLITLIKRPELQPFAEAHVIKVITKSLKDIDDEDKEGHEDTGTTDEMYKRYSEYYKQPVTPDTEVKIVKFKIDRLL